MFGLQSVIPGYGLRDLSKGSFIIEDEEELKQQLPKLKRETLLYRVWRIHGHPHLTHCKRRASVRDDPPQSLEAGLPDHAQNYPDTQSKI